MQINYGQLRTSERREAKGESDRQRKRDREREKSEV